MEQIIERLKVVLSEITQIKTALSVERSQVAETGRKQDEVAKCQAVKETELENREAAVKPIEDVVAFKNAAEEVAEEVNKGRIVLENAKNGFDAFMKSEKDQLATKKADVKKLEELYNREIEALKKAKEEVALEMANVKGKVLGDLAKNI